MAPVESARMFRPVAVSAPLVPKLVSMAPADETLYKENVYTQGPWLQSPVSMRAYREPEGPVARLARFWLEPEGGAGKDTVPLLPHEVSRAPVDVSRTSTGTELWPEYVDPPRLNDPLEPWTIH
ncbi:unannotated protein [freshwater metagenome]|uniref:Unannotated protein n=1 Tax=freshwater metagenome TaxID=449393 RepID=A0A6J6FT24_9ZZZZ